MKARDLFCVILNVLSKLLSCPPGLSVVTNETRVLSHDAFVSVGCKGCGDSLSAEWHPLNRRRAGPLPSVCTAGLSPALQQRAGHLSLVIARTYTRIVSGIIISVCSKVHMYALERDPYSMSIYFSSVFVLIFFPLKVLL